MERLSATLAGVMARRLAAALMAVFLLLPIVQHSFGTHYSSTAYDAPALAASEDFHPYIAPELAAESSRASPWKAPEGDSPKALAAGAQALVFACVFRSPAYLASLDRPAAHCRPAANAPRAPPQIA